MCQKELLQKAMPKDVEIDVKEQTNAEKVTEIDTQLCKNINKNNDDLNILQPTCETSKKAQNFSIETQMTAPL